MVETIETILLGMLSIALSATLYPGLATAFPGPPVDAGTTITQLNWQKYREFMSDGLIALFESKQFWHLPADLRIEVGPTTSIPLPKAYLSDTARYSSQVKLVRTASGGYVPIGYIAGLPFPHPLSGDPNLIGQQIFWDAYYRYQPSGLR
jgi:hypothetical protein